MDIGDGVMRDAARRLTRVAVLAAVLALTGAAVMQGSAAAVTDPVSSFNCNGSIVAAAGPTVVAAQWSQGHDVQWQAELWVQTAAGWQVSQRSVVHSAEAQTSDFDPGATTGIAGPSWFNPTTRSWFWYTAFVADPGYAYAVRNVVWEASQSRAAWATVVWNGQTYGQTCQL
jgi:hypothetical protein